MSDTTFSNDQLQALRELGADKDLISKITERNKNLSTGKSLTNDHEPTEKRLDRILSHMNKLGFEVSRSAECFSFTNEIDTAAVRELALSVDKGVHYVYAKGQPASTIAKEFVIILSEWHIVAEYTACAWITIESIEEELGIKWSDVDDYYIKWEELILTMKDGSTEICPMDSLDKHDIDTKRPTKCYMDKF